MTPGLERRVVTAAVLAPAVSAAVLWAPQPALVLIFAAVALAGACEWSALGGGRGFPLLLAAAGCAVLVLPETGVLAVLAAGALWWAYASLVLLRTGAGWPRGTAAHALLGLLVLLPAWTALVELARGPQGRASALLCLVVVWAADSAAYVVGHAWGRRRLLSAVSPNKTVEGALGGLLAALLAGAGGGAALGMGPFEVAALATLGLAAGAASIVGDLTESLVKRRAHVKDSGRLLPGHGGVLDRIDGLTAAAPVFALGARWVF